MTITTEEFSIAITALLEDHGVDVTDEAGFATDLAALFVEWTAEGSEGFPTPALALRVATLLANWNTNQLQFRAWWVGPADGGFTSDGTVAGGGYYPLTDGLGNTRYLPSPAKMLGDVERGYSALEVLVEAGILPPGTTEAEFADWLRAPAVDAVASLQAGWTSAYDAAVLASSTAQTALDEAVQAQADADAAVVAAQQAASDAADSEAAAGQSAADAAASLAAIGTAQEDAEDARDAAILARNAAQASAAAAALSELNADGSAADALASEIDAEAAALAAAGSESAAGASAADAEAIALEVDAELASMFETVGLTFPADLKHFEFFTFDAEGDFNAAAPLTAADIDVVGGAQGFLADNGIADVFMRPIARANTDIYWGVDWRVFCQAAGSSSGRVRVVCVGLDEQFQEIGRSEAAFTVNTTGQFFEGFRRFTYNGSNGSTQWPAGAVWLRFGLRLNANASGVANPGAQTHVRAILLRDDTKKRQAEVYRNYAQASADAALISSGAAAGHAASALASADAAAASEATTTAAAAAVAADRLAVAADRDQVEIWRDEIGEIIGFDPNDYATKLYAKRQAKRAALIYGS